MILQKKKEMLVNVVTLRRNPYYGLVIYLNAAKVEQYRLVDYNSREK